MKETLSRSITGIIYVVLLLGAVFLNTDAFDFLFMAFGLACLYEFKRLVKLRGYYIFIAYLSLWWVYIYLVQGGIAVDILLVFSLMVDLALLYFLFSKRILQFSEVQKFLIAVLYIGGGFIFLTMIP